MVIVSVKIKFTRTFIDTGKLHNSQRTPAFTVGVLFNYSPAFTVGVLFNYSPDCACICIIL